MGRKILSVFKKNGFEVATEGEAFQGASLVVATGGLSIPKIGATGFGHQLARQFGLNLVPTSPALDGFRFSPPDLKKFADLTGVALDSRLEAGGVSFRENILFTHAGLSGPAALQASLYWKPGQPIEINFIPDQKPEQWLGWFEDLRDGGSQEEVRLLLRRYLPNRLAERLAELELPSGATPASLKGSALADFCQKLQAYQLTPQATVGYLKAEVTRGGVDTDELSSKTMESRKVPGLFFIGEVVDVTGWLGGYNFQWAWSSGWAAGQSA